MKTAIISVFAFAIGLGVGGVLLIWSLTPGLPEQPVIDRYLPATTTTTMVMTTPLTPGEQQRLEEIRSTDEITTETTTTGGH